MKKKKGELEKAPKGKKIVHSQMGNAGYGKEYEEMDEKLLKHTKKSRAKKLPVTQISLKIVAKRILKKRYGVDTLANKAYKRAPLKFGRTWFRGFARRHNLIRRAPTNYSKLSHKEQWTAMQRFHTNLRQDALKKSASGYEYDGSKWGRFPPETRFNMDEVGLSLSLSVKQTLTLPNERLTGRISVVGGHNSRFATMMLTTCGDRHTQVPPALIFKGKGHLESICHQRLKARKFTEGRGNEWFDLDLQTIETIIKGVIAESQLSAFYA